MYIGHLAIAVAGSARFRQRGVLTTFACATLAPDLFGLVSWWFGHPVLGHDPRVVTLLAIAFAAFAWRWGHRAALLSALLVVSHFFLDWTNDDSVNPGLDFLVQSGLFAVAAIYWLTHRKPARLGVKALLFFAIIQLQLLWDALRYWGA